MSPLSEHISLWRKKSLRSPSPLFLSSSRPERVECWSRATENMCLGGLVCTFPSNLAPCLTALFFSSPLCRPGGFNQGDQLGAGRTELVFKPADLPAPQNSFTFLQLIEPGRQLCIRTQRQGVDGQMGEYTEISSTRRKRDQCWRKTKKNKKKTTQTRPVDYHWNLQYQNRWGGEGRGGGGS